MISEWQAVIGLEIHVQLATASKIFSGAPTAFGAKPNSQACPVDLGMPGVLPVLNAEVYPKAIAFGLAIGATINARSVFDRKNYFYPDLPKGYQITQMDEPILVGGTVGITLKNGSTKIIRVARAHLEEDAGKSLHENFQDITGIDLNRAGTPLLEIVSEPEMSSAEEAVSYAKAVHQLVTYLSVSDGNMSEASLRCDANVSIRKVEETKLGTRTEIKNLNSFKFLERAIECEIERQIELLRSGEEVKQETRLYDPDKAETRLMRSKETATDYRYFPEPDLLPVVIDEAFINDVRSQMPELPTKKFSRYQIELGLNEQDASLISGDLDLANYFERTVAICNDPIQAANWLRGELLANINRDDVGPTKAPVTPELLAELILKIKDGTISGKTAKAIFSALWHKETESVVSYIDAKSLQQVSDNSALSPVVDQIIAENPKQVAQFQAGKTKLLGFFVGQVMKKTAGTANPKQVNELVSSRLKSVE